MSSSGRGRHEVAVEAQELARPLARDDDEAAEHGRDRVRPEGEAGDDAEVAAAAPERPEEVGMLARRWR